MSELEHGRCGPLCQHPGCWQSTQAPHGSKCSYYSNYLSRLASRKSKKIKKGTKNEVGGRHSSLTADGLPTLKVQTIDHLDNNELTNTTRRVRAKSLPPVRISTEKQENNHFDTFVQANERKTVNFIQMHLEEEVIIGDEPSELVFSPVLIWKPSKCPHTHHTYTMTDLPLSTPSHIPTYHHNKSRHHPSMLGDPRQPRSALHLKRTDLTNSLPPEQVSDMEQQNVSEESCPRVTTAEAEIFSYLGDIPRHIVAEIIQQLRSESTSNMERTLPVYSSPEPDKGKHPTLPTTLPSSLTYDLDTRKLSRTKQSSTPKMRTTSFSRELSQRPLEVLHRKSSDPVYNLTTESTCNHRRFKLSPIHVATIEPPLPVKTSTAKPLEILLQRQSLTHNNLLQTDQQIEEKHASPSRINLELSDLHVTTPEHSRQVQLYVGENRSKHRILNPSVNTLRPFSEETCTTEPQPSPVVNEPRRVDSQRVLSSTSPDFMLVGAQFTGDRMVLTDREHKIEHQLTDTDSDANILLPHVHKTEEVEQSEISIFDEPVSDVRQPPSTAVDDYRSLGENTVDNRVEQNSSDCIKLTPLAVETAPICNLQVHSKNKVEVLLSDRVEDKLADGIRTPPSIALN